MDDLRRGPCKTDLRPEPLGPRCRARAGVNCDRFIKRGFGDRRLKLRMRRVKMR